MATLSVAPERPVDPLTVTILDAVAKVAGRARVRYVLVGAMARDIVFHHVHGIRPPVATLDVDIAVAVENWGEFDRFRSGLLRTERFTPHATKPHRLTYTPDRGSLPYPLDILAFGGVETEDSHVEWRAEGVRMNVVGYRDAVRSALDVRLTDTVTTRTLSIPGFVVLKLFAWQDRGYRGSAKDATDLAFALVNYAKAGNHDRLYEGLALEQLGYDLEVAGAHLLGEDVRRVCSEEVVRAMLTILSDPRERTILTTDMARQRVGALVDLGELEGRLALFEAGLRGDPPSENR